MMLRKLEEKDAEGMLEWMHDSDIQRFLQFPMMSRTKDDVLEFIRTAEIYPFHGKNIHYAVVDESDEYLGTVSLKAVNMEAKNAEFGISFRKKAQGRGIAAQATRELLKKAFEDFGFERVYLCVFASNLKAIKLHEKIGFTYEGEFRKHVCVRGRYETLKWYGMLKTEYFAKLGG